MISFITLKLHRKGFEIGIVNSESFNEPVHASDDSQTIISVAQNTNEPSILENDEDCETPKMSHEVKYAQKYSSQNAAKNSTNFVFPMNLLNKLSENEPDSEKTKKLQAKHVKFEDDFRLENNEEPNFELTDDFQIIDDRHTNDLENGNISKD